ncbi:carboxypeptidase M32, partial [Acidianus sp. RZ1]|uniref:carboxypeptidase M32 n=1 Tax=Acidianus sp. RZ1 TaxID=1540082 RepID=UPI0014908FFA
MESILSSYRRYWALDHSSALLNWDSETYLPEDGFKYRGEALAQIDSLQREEILRLAPLVEKVKEEDLDDKNRGILRVLKRMIKYYTAIPTEISEKLIRLTTEAFNIWRKAKAKSDFSLFSPYLNEIVEIEKIIAEKLGYRGDPYNALLDLYEEGATVDDIDNVFNQLIPSSKRILENVLSEGYYPKEHPLEKVKYDINQMKKVNEDIIDLLGMPKSRFRMDISPHPFTIRISINDVRITTRYEGIDFKSTIFSVIHESGHATYELMIDPNLEFTPLASGASSGIHESQSRFWENMIGRSRDFVKILFPILTENLDFVREYNEEEIYKYFNVVRPSSIRVDADELTYNFHIALRYNIEKGLINGSIDVKDLPSIWEEKMMSYLGLDIKNDSEGVLQDMHWSNGSFGYFPTYTLGNVVAGITYSKLPNLHESIMERKFDNIRDLLAEKLYKYGRTYPPKVLLERSFNETYNPEYLIKYLENKYLN